MSESSTNEIFLRTLPLFDNRDRDVIQRLLHHAVESLRYDHPDRKIARDLYHEIHEGEAIRLLIGSEINNETLVITPSEHEGDVNRILERFVEDMPSEFKEWERISLELDKWRKQRNTSDGMKIAFQYLH